MPSSTPDFIPQFVKQIQELQPKTVLDVGVGYGRNGFLLREYLEAWKDRVHPKDWQVQIDGIEAWEPYTTLPWIDSIYNYVAKCTLQDWCESQAELRGREGCTEESYDVVIAGDVIEHLPKEEALACLRFLLSTTKKTLVVSIPLGPNWLNNQVVDGNPHEAHKSTWERDELLALGECYHEEKTGPAGREVGLFFFKGQWAAPTPGAVVPSSPAAVKTDSRLSNTMLHVHNMRRCGGTGNFVLDMARCFPEFNHVALCVNDPNGDPVWIQAVSDHMRTMYAPQLTKAILAELNPRVVILHSTPGEKLEGNWPYYWLQEGGRYVIAWHHTGTYPLLPADLDVFVSEYVQAKYAAILSRMKKRVVIPPCTDMAPYVAIHRNGAPQSPLVTTAGKGCEELTQLIAAGVFNWTFDHKPPGFLGAMPDYLSRFPFAVIWSGYEETWCRTVSEAMAAGCVTVAHRSGAIPEQITHGQNGFLFGSGMELVEVMSELDRLPSEQLAEVAAAGREWAAANVGFPRLRERLYPHLLKGLLRAVS